LLPTGAVTGAVAGTVAGAAFAPPGPGLGGSLSGGSFGTVSLSSEERDRVRAETLALVRQQVEARLNEVSASEEALLG
jgi:hypothetical protein